MILRSFLLQFSSYSLVFLFLIQCGNPDSDREANRLFVEAYQLVESANENKQNDPVSAYRYYRGALDNIDSIINNYPGTQIAVTVTQQQSKIGELTIGELRNIVPKFEARARALDGFHELTGYLVGRLNDDVRQAEKLLRYAMWAYDNDNDIFEEVIQNVTRTADRHWNTEITDPVYHMLARVHAKTGDWERSFRMINQIQYRDLLFQALTSIIKEGLFKESVETNLNSFLGMLDYVSPTDRVRLITKASDELFISENPEMVLSLVQGNIPSPEEQDKLNHIEALMGLVQVLSSRGEFDAARDVITKIEDLDRGYADFALRDLATEYARKGNLDEAMEIVSSFEREYFQSATIAAISVQHALNGRVTEALYMLDGISDNVSEKTESQIEIACILSEFGDHNRSDSLLSISRPLIDEIDSTPRRSAAWSRISEIYIQRDDRSMAAEALNASEEHAIQISGADNANTRLADIFKRWVQLGRPDRALGLAVHFQMNASTFEDVITSLLSHAIANRYHDLARSLAGMTDRQHYYLVLLNAIYLDIGDLDRSASLAYEIRSFYWRSHALADLAAFQRVSGDDSKSGIIATDALQTILRIRDESEQELAMLYVTSRLSASGVIMNDERRTITGNILSQLYM